MEWRAATVGNFLRMTATDGLAVGVRKDLVASVAEFKSSIRGDNTHYTRVTTTIGCYFEVKDTTDSVLDQLQWPVLTALPLLEEEKA